MKCYVGDSSWLSIANETSGLVGLVLMLRGRYGGRRGRDSWRECSSALRRGLTSWQEGFRNKTSCTCQLSRYCLSWVFSDSQPPFHSGHRQCVGRLKKIIKARQAGRARPKGTLWFRHESRFLSKSEREGEQTPLWSLLIKSEFYQMWAGSLYKRTWELSFGLRHSCHMTKVSDWTPGSSQFCLQNQELLLVPTHGDSQRYNLMLFFHTAAYSPLLIEKRKHLDLNCLWA